MSRPIHLRRARRAGIGLVAGFAFAAVPVAAQASQVNLATTSPFVALAGTTVTNSGPSVLNGELGVAPGTALVGFGLPAVVNGATHDNDAVATQAQADLTTAYNVAAGQPVSGANDLSNTDLGNRTLTAGAYKYTSAAQLTGPLTLDAQGNPDAQFVFEIGSKLTTAPASSVVLIRGASPCNVFWQVGSSATLDSTTLFQGNLMALTSISVNNGVHVIGRLLARNGQISLINDVLDGAQCGTAAALPPGGSGTPSSGTPGSPASGTGPSNGTATVSRAPRATCAAGFRATVHGHLIQRVVFRLDGKRIANRAKSPFTVFVRALPGRHNVSARVTFKDATRAKTMNLGYRACASAVLTPAPGRSQFTG
jgi:hypothetical protein